MKTVRHFPITTALSVLFLFALTFAQTTAATKTIKPPPPIDTRILIKAIDPKANTVTFKYMRDAKAPDHTYGVDDMTQLKLNNVAGKFAAIKVGMLVDSYLERDNDNLDALSLSGYGASLTPAAKPKAPAKPKPPTPSSPAPPNPSP